MVLATSAKPEDLDALRRTLDADDAISHITLSQDVPSVLDVDAVVFDIGETLVDETRMWESWADWLGVPRLTLLGLIGWGAGNDAQPGDVVRMLRPGIDIAEELRLPARRIADVGDRVDDDVLPALQAGTVAVHIRRGPWGWVQARGPDAQPADLRIDALRELLQ